MPGIPGIIIGHNERVAWGVTNAFPDVQDVYIERFDPGDPSRYEVNGEWRTAEMVRETIRVRGRKPVIETIRYTRHGPVFTDLFDDRHADLSLRWTMLDAGNHLRAVLATNRAADWNEFREGLRHWTFPSQNVVYADTAGNIGYMMPGRVPRRRSGQGLAPLPGWTDDSEWLDTIPFEELPALYNPPEGMIATANNHVAGDSYPYLLSSEWLPDYRARRIRELLATASPLRLTDHGRIQNETVSLLARRFLASALPVLSQMRADDPGMRDALLRLQQWDGDMRADSATPSLFFGLLTHFTHAAVSQAVGPKLAESLLGKSPDAGFLLMPFYEMSYELAMRWLESDPPDWVGDVRPLLVPALRRTLDVLRKEYGDDPTGWRWGRLHRIAFVHQLSRIPAIGRLWKPLWLPAGGDGFSINQCDVSPHFPPGPATIIASCRLILDVGDWDAALAALPGGQSGQPVSPHYQDRIAEWQEGRYFPLLFSRDSIMGAAAGVVTLTPAGR
jgi:penicillin amidase